MKSGRNSFINVLKGIISFMVVSGHRGLPGDFGVIADAMGRFAVPAFFMISGYFIWNEDKERVAQKVNSQIIKICKLMICANILYLIWGMVSIKLYGDSITLWLKEVFHIFNILKFIILNVSKAGIHLWFLGALLYCYCILSYINKKELYHVLYKSIPVLLVLNLLIGEFLAGLGILTPVSLTRNFLLQGIPFFALGNFIHRYEEEIRTRITNLQCLSGIIGGCLLSCVERLFVARSEIYIGSIVSAFFLFVVAIKNPKVGKNSLIEQIGIYYSVFVYIFHMTPLNAVSIIGEYHDFVQNKVFIWTAPFIIWSVTMIGIWLYYQLINRFRSNRLAV